MRLNDPAVTSFSFEGKEYPINLSFDLVLDAFDIIKADFLTNHEKACLCLDILIGKNQYSKNDAVGIWNFVFDSFIKVEQKPFIEYDFYGEPMKIREEEDLMDLEIDAEAIYASFIQAYNIDLIERQGKFSWHSFRALLHNLPSESPLKKLMQIRAWKPHKDDSAEFKQEMSDLQRYYALEETEE